MSDPDIFLEQPPAEPAGNPLPCSPDVEWFIIGAMLADESNLAQALHECLPQHFYTQPDRIPPPSLLFRAMTRLYARQTIVSIESVHEELYRNWDIDPRDSEAALQQAAMTYRGQIPRYNLPDELQPVLPTDMAAAIQQLHEYHELREMVNFGEELAGRALSLKEPPQELADFARDRVNRFGLTLVEQTDVQEIGALADDALERAEMAVASGKPLVECYTTAFHKIDAQTGGFRPGEAWTWEAPTNSGKSRITLYSAARLAGEVPVGYISLEMGHQRFREYYMSTVASVYGQPTTPAQLWESVPDEMWRARWADAIAASRIPKLNIIQEPRGASLSKIASWCRMLARKGCKVVYIDQVQSIREYQDGRHRERGSAALCGKPIVEAKRWAADLGICVVLVHQTNRVNYNNPTLAGGADSGDFERHSDHVLLIYDIQSSLIDQGFGFIDDDGVYRKPRESDDKKLIQRKVTNPRTIKLVVAKARGPERGALFTTFHYGWGTQVDNIDGRWCVV